MTVFLCHPEWWRCPLPWKNFCGRPWLL